MRAALFDAFQAGQSVKPFLATPKDAARCAQTIARLEQETGARYADELLAEMALSREIVEEAAGKLAA